MYLFIYLIFWTLTGWVASRMAEKRGRSVPLWFILGVVLGVIALIILYFLPPKQVIATAGISVSPSTAPAAVTPSASPSLEKLWYYLDKESKQYGPMSFYALQGAWDDDQITASTYVWNEEMENWKKLEELNALLRRIQRAT